ncbi:MAG: disulfide oxidoreductase [Berkelbacteria bacterium GW2011_GWA1_36_9]|uniref:Disulfide oxidoreductase n=1 Tax=Berkelbacteria bacterium GW2011_GWA1_36_9 TaxID=1618331 RepID=A0A0G0I0A4_9BACT|nr:MAG: disulfide oxidoreductase [Berkelbacteria bacterium GW2011_GWA1_36_9]
MKVTRESSIEEIAQDPKKAEILIDSGLHCLGCMASHFENIEQGLKGHGHSDEEIDKIIDELNSTN